MAVLRKQSFPENLETFSVLVTDTSENSSYFKITDLPDTFTGGKNSFLIQGSEDLVQDTIVKVEIKDSNGNIIYTEAGEGIPEYYEGTSKPVAVYVYPDTAYGPCTLTILGELAEYKNERGIKTGVPAEWRNKYNVRWQKTINVNPNLTNNSKIRFYRRPKVKITETVLPVYNRSVNRTTISGSISGISVQPIAGSNFRTFKGDTIYYLSTTSSVFSSSMEGENINITGLPQSYTTIVKDVVNSNKLLVTSPYYETSSNLATSYQTVTNFDNAQFNLAYNSNISLTNSSINASYAKIRLTDLEAFSGDPARLKVYSKRKADIGNYSLIEDVRLESSEIFISDSYSGSISVNTGQFANQSIINDFWTYSDINGNLYSKDYDNILLASSVKLNDNNTLNLSQNPQRIFYYKTTIEFSKDTEYEIGFTHLLSSSTYFPAKLEIYGSGSAFVNTNIVSELGKKITSYESNENFRRYDSQQIIFKPDLDGTGTIVFAVYQGNWQLSNISLRASGETNFSPNEITLNVEVPTVVNNDEYEFRFEFYDVNNNYVPVNVVTSSIFTGGSTLADVATGTARFLQVSPDSNVFPFGYLNNYDFQELNSFSSVPIGSTSILFNIQASNLTGSVTFTSAAYDSGGVYINPGTYTGQYPGFLTNVTTSSAILDVANFTGSMASTIEVRRIEYTASLGEFTDIISIYKVVEGTPGSDGENGEQYIIKPLNGTAIKNSDPNAFIEVQLVKISGNSLVDVTSGNVKLVTGSSDTVITAGNGIVAGVNGVEYNAKFYAQKIDGLLEVKAKNIVSNQIVDTISLADITDGLTTGFIEASNGLILSRNPNTNTYTPTTTALTASFFDGLGNLYTSSLLVTPNYSDPNDQLKYQTGIVDPNINLDFVRTTAGITISNNTFVNTNGLTVKYTFTDPYSGGVISTSEGVAITVNGSSGTSGEAGSSGTSGQAGSSGESGSSGTSGAAGANAISVIISPPTQTVNVTTAGVYDSPSNIIIRLYEDGVIYNYDGTPTYGNSTFRITNVVNGSNISIDGTTSGSITPTTPNTTAGIITTFDIIYKSSTGVVSDILPQTHVISVALVGQTGPGIVFTGEWEQGRAYQYSDLRKDVVLWSRFGTQPYDTYYVTLRQHTSDGSTNSTGDGAPNYSTGSVGSAWLELGQEDYFVAAKIAVFEESFVKNTLNIGTSNNGGISSANITLYGGNSYPYISLGQSDTVGSQGYGVNGIFLGAVNDVGVRKYRFSIASGSNYLKWNGTDTLEISGTLYATQGKIGGFTISENTIYAGAGNYSNTDTGFFFRSASAGTGIFSLSDKLTWNGNTLSINGDINVNNGSMAGLSIQPSKMFFGIGSFGNANTSFYVDNTGQFSLKDRLKWDGSVLYVSGTINAVNGNFSGDITSSAVISGSILKGGSININNTFSVTPGGILAASGAYIEGTITAQSGLIGGWSIEQTKLSSPSGTIQLSPEDRAIQIYSGSNNVLVVNVSDQNTLSSLTGGTITIGASDTSINTTTKQASDSTTSSTTKIVTGILDVSSSVENVPSGSTGVSQSGPYNVSMYISQSSVIELEVAFDQGSSTSVYTGHDIFGTVGCIIRTGSADNTDGTVTTLETAVSLVSSGLNISNQTVTYSVGVNNLVSKIVTLEASKTYYFVPFFKLSRNKITGAIVNPKLYRSTGNGLPPSTWDAVIDVFVPKLKTIQVVQNVSKSELIGGGFQVVRDTSNYVKVERLGTDPILQVGGNVKVSSLAGSGNRAVYSDPTGILTNSSSDIRLKTNIRPVSYGIDSVLKMNPIYFNWKDKNMGEQNEIGFIAQEIQKITPEVIGTNSNGMLSIDYAKMVAVLVKAIQEQQEQINELKNKQN